MDVLTYLIDISTEECEDLISAATVGRLGVIVDGRPEIFPVNHVYDRDNGCVVFPTNASTKFRAALSWPTVAFEVDGVDRNDSRAWSVAVVGRAEELTDAAEIKRLARQRAVLWAAGPSTRWLRIVPAKMTGRWISAVVGQAQAAAPGVAGPGPSSGSGPP